MNTTSRILGESITNAFDDLLKLSSAAKGMKKNSQEIFDMVREYERKHGLSKELFEIFLHIKDAAENIEMAHSGSLTALWTDSNEGLMQDLLDHYNQLCGQDLFYIVVKSVQTGKIDMGSLLDKVMRGDIFNDGVDLSKANRDSNPYIEAIAQTFGVPDAGVMASAEAISYVENFHGGINAD